MKKNGFIVGGIAGGLLALATVAIVLKKKGVFERRSYKRR